MKPDDPLIKLRAKLFRGFADRTRLSIIEALRNGRKSVTEIIEELSLPQSTVSSHLTCLRDCNLITVEKVGRKHYYRLSSPLISEILEKTDELLVKVYDDVLQCVNYLEEKQ